MNIKNLALGTLTATIAASMGMVSGTAMATTMDYASVNHSMINFVGNGTFNFSPALNNLQITDGTAAGLYGQILGTYTIGAVTVSGPLSTAAVSGSGFFQVNDGSFLFSANLTWVDIDQFGTGGTLNTVGTVNLTGITYAGTNPDLLAMKNAGQGIDVLTFQFVPAVTLAHLKNSHHSTSFSGSLITEDVPDGGATIALLGGGLLLIGGFRRKLGR